MLTWGVVGALFVGIYGQRALGAVLANTDRVSARWQRVLGALPLAIIAGVIALQTFTTSRQLSVDASIVGIGVAAFCAWRRLPILVTVLAAAAATALVRAVA